MDVQHDHVIHSRGGQLGSRVTTLEDAQRIAAQAFQTTQPQGVVLHFHGGLVSESAALGIADRLALRYSAAGAYPVFSVWESGLVESVRNNLKDILQDKVFHELLKKVSEWVLREGSSSIATRGSGTVVDKARLREDFDKYLTGKSAEPPLQEQSPATGQMTKGAEPDEDELALKIESELDEDPTFQGAITGLLLADGRLDPGVASKGAGGIEPLPVEVLVDQTAIDQMHPRVAGNTRGGIVWYKIAKFVAKVVISVIRRFVHHRDHGSYTTTVEEVLRAAYLAKVGEAIWRQMKQDTWDALDPASETGAGNVVLSKWAELANAGKAQPRITLVGHSTGAVYINNWIKRSAEVAPKLAYDIVLLAPACRAEDFADVLSAHAQRINGFRTFGMQDAVEQQDRLVSIIYPRSLLYFVSGVVEGDVDIPLLGMQRYIADREVFNPADFPQVEAARKFLAAGDKPRAVWSITEGGPGLNSASVTHGDFDDDLKTLDSLSSILTTGY